jgi:hypothetical protein
MSANGTVYFRGIDAAGNTSQVTSYEVTNIDKVAPEAPVANASTTEPTNQNVTVTAVFSDDTKTRQYSINGSSWKTYTSAGVVMSANGTVNFRGKDAAGNTSQVTSYAVTNIDKVAPSKPTASASTTETTNQDVTVTAVFSDDSATKQYSTDGTTWNTYTSGVVMSANGTVYFRGIDAVGNISEVASYAVTNINKLPPTTPSALTVTQSGTKFIFTWGASTVGDSEEVSYELTLVRNGHQQTVTEVEGTTVTLDLPESNYSWSIVAKDKSGNASERALGDDFRAVMPVAEPNIINLTGDASPALAQGTQGDDMFRLAASGKWGTYHVARWNGGTEIVSIANFNRFSDALDGKGGYDAVALPDGDNALIFHDLLSSKASGANASARLTGISEIRGGSGSDVIDLTAAQGGSYQNDILLLGGAGDDHLWAGSGDDILIGGVGSDDLRGGAGNDTYLFGTDWGQDTLLDDGGTLVFDNSFKDKLAFGNSGDGTVISDDRNSVTVSWQVNPGDVVYADVNELSSMRLNTIKSFLA